MSFQYPRTIEIRRQTDPETTGSTVSVGLQSYEGRIASEAVTGDETVIATGIRANIQVKSEGRVTGKTVLPSNAAGEPTYRVFIPRSALAKGVIREHDIIIDDEGYRYSVSAPYWNSMGYRLGCVRVGA